MTYGDPEIVKQRLGSLYKSSATEPGQLLEEDITLAVNDADTTIKSELRDAGLTPPDDTDSDIDDLKLAANLLARADCLDTVYESVEGERSAAARTFEKQAYNLIDKYINKPSTETDERAPRMRSFIAGNYTPTAAEDEDDYGDDEW